MRATLSAQPIARRDACAAMKAGASMAMRLNED